MKMERIAYVPKNDPLCAHIHLAVQLFTLLWKPHLMPYTVSVKVKLSEYDQKMPQLHTADQSKKEGKHQESIQSSTIPDPGHHVEK